MENNYTTSNDRQGSVNARSVTEAAEIYADRGLGRFIPVISKNGKHPVPTKVTGNIDSAEACERARRKLDGHTGNVALVMDSMTEDFDLMAVDVDDYDGKNGYANLMQLCAKLGVEWTESLRTTRRGAADNSGKRLFRIPKGIRLTSIVCKGVEVIQYHHRYAVCFPSVVDGMPEQWISDEGEILALEDLPSAAELPELPERLTAHLTEGMRSDPFQPGISLGDDEACDWLAKATRNPHGTPGGPLLAQDLSVTALAALFGDPPEDRHDLMVKLVRRVVRGAVEYAAEGVNVALDSVRSTFTEAVTADGSRTEGLAHAEYVRSLRGEVNKVRGEVEHGQLRPLAVLLPGADLSAEAFSNLALASGSDDGDDTEQSTAGAVDYGVMDEITDMLWTHGGDDLPAALLLRFCGDLKAWRQDLHSGDPLSLFDVERGRVVPAGELRPYLRRFVLPVMIAYRHALPPAEAFDGDSDTEKEAKAEAEALAKISGTVIAYCQNESKMRYALPSAAGLLVERGDVLAESQADSREDLLGLSDGWVVDLNVWIAGGSLTESVRARARDEILMKHLNVSSTEIFTAAERLADGATADIDRVLSLVFGDLKSTVLELLSYGLHGSNPHRLIWGLMGGTGTGKSTVMDFTAQMLGDYGAPTTMQDLSVRGGGNNPALAAAMRARVTFTSEFSQDTKAERDALKAISGNELVSCTAKFMNTEWHRGTMIVFSTNEAARVDFDEALEDRFVVVPTVATQAQVIDLLAEISAAHGGKPWQEDPLNKVWLLSMLAENFRRPWLSGFRKTELPSDVQTTTAKFVAEANPANTAIAERLVFTAENEDFLSTKIILDTLNEDLDEPLKTQGLRNLLEPRGAREARPWRQTGSPDGKPKQVRGYVGVRLRVEDDDKPDLRIAYDVDTDHA